MIPAVCACHALGKPKTTTPCKGPAWVYIDIWIITWRQIDLAAGRADGELLVAARALRQAAQVGALDARARGSAVAQRRQVLLCGLRAATCLMSMHEQVCHVRARWKRCPASPGAAAPVACVITHWLITTCFVSCVSAARGNKIGVYRKGGYPSAQASEAGLPSPCHACTVRLAGRDEEAALHQCKDAVQ